MTPIRITFTLFFIALFGFGFINGKNLPENATNEMRDKRGLDAGYGYGDYTAAYSPSFWAGPKTFSPSPSEISHIIATAKQATADVFAAQQRVALAKEEVIEQQRLAKEKEAQALIAQQKSESAHQILRSEAQNVVYAQQKLAKAKAEAAEAQRLASVKESEAASAIQLSAHHAHAEIQKAEQAAKISALKRAHHNVPLTPIPLKGFPFGQSKLLLAPLSFSPEPWRPAAPIAPIAPYFSKGPAPWY